MQKFVYIYLLALLATPLFCNSHETSSSKSAEDNKNTCTDIVEEDGSSGKPLLIEALYNISITLSGSSQTTFENFIIYLEETYFESGNFTSVEIVLECSFEIYQFFQQNTNYYTQFQFITIGSWGSFYDLFQVGIYLSSDNFGGCWSENSSGEYDLLIAFQTFQQTLSISDQSTFNTYITQLETILYSSDDTSTKYAQYYSLCLQIITDHSSWESAFLSTDCGSMGSLYMLLQISVQYYRISLVPTLFSGSPQCQFVVDLESCLSNPAYSISASDKAYINATIQSFQQTVDDESLSYTEKVQTIIYQYEQFLLTFYYLENVFLSFEISAEFGCFEDFLSMFTFGQTQECWPVGFETTNTPLPTTTVTSVGASGETQVTSGEASGETSGGASGETQVTSGEASGETSAGASGETQVTSGEASGETSAGASGETSGGASGETKVTSGEASGETSGGASGETKATSGETSEETEVTSGETSEETEVTSGETSEETESTILTTLLTTLLTTTKPATVNCATAPKQCLVLNNGVSIILTSSTKQWGSWTASQKTNWKNECNRFTTKFIKNKKMTQIQKIKGVVNSIKAYVKMFAYMKVKIFAIKIGQWGTIGKLCGCY